MCLVKVWVVSVYTCIPSSERSEPTTGPSSEAKPSAEGDETMTISDSDSESHSHSDISDIGTDVGMDTDTNDFDSVRSISPMSVN